MQVNAVKIKYLREQRCWSQLQLSEMAGISVRTLQRLEAKSVASQETIKSIAAVLEIGCDQLLSDKSNSLPISDEQNGNSFVVEKPSAESLPIAPSKGNEHEQEQDKLIQLRRKLFLAFFIVIASNLFGFYSVYSAYDAAKIDLQTFHFLKNSISITLIFCTGLLCFKAYRNGLFKKSDLF
jgi:transcriptional regulator with XRE-family HTH domain